jgi:hypothetical protein
MKKFFILSLLMVFFFGNNEVIFSLTGSEKNIEGSQETKALSLKKEIIRVNYIEIMTAYNILRQYMSSSGTVQPLREGNLLIIEDRPEFVDKMLSILKEIDIKPLDLEFKIDLIMGNIQDVPEQRIDKKLASDPLIIELENLLHFNNFEWLDTSIIKIQENSFSQVRMGGMGMDFQLHLKPLYIQEDKSESFQVELNLIQDKEPTPSEKNRNIILLATKLTLKNGERQVVGVSKLNGGDKGLILILSGRIYK